MLRKGKNKPHKVKETMRKVNNHQTIHERNKEIPDIKLTQTFGHLEDDTIVGKITKVQLLL